MAGVHVCLTSSKLQVGYWWLSVLLCAGRSFAAVWALPLCQCTSSQLAAVPPAAGVPIKPGQDLAKPDRVLLRQLLWCCETYQPFEGGA